MVLLELSDAASGMGEGHFCQVRVLEWSLHEPADIEDHMGASFPASYDTKKLASGTEAQIVSSAKKRRSSSSSNKPANK